MSTFRRSLSISASSTYFLDDRAALNGIRRPDEFSGPDRARVPVIRRGTGTVVTELPPDEAVLPAPSVRPMLHPYRWLHVPYSSIIDIAMTTVIILIQPLRLEPDSVT